MRTPFKTLTVGLVLATAAMAGCSSTTGGSAGAIQDEVTSPAPTSSSSSAGPTSSPDPVGPSPAPTEAPASPVASPTDLPSPTDSPDDPALLGSTDVNNNVCDSGLEYECGDIGSSGVGTIFYASSAPFACGANMESSCNYLEVAPNGWNGKLVNCNGCGGNPNKTSDWGQSSIGTGKGYAYCTGSGNDNRIPNASGVIIGFGYMNTSAMLSMCDSGNAAEQVRGYTGGGQTDWSLPSLYELNALFYYPDRNAIGGFAADDYWSSTQYSKYNAWFQNFTKGNQRYYEEKNPKGVRPVRAF